MANEITANVMYLFMPHSPLPQIKEDVADSIFRMSNLTIWAAPYLFNFEYSIPQSPKYPHQ